MDVASRSGLRVGKSRSFVILPLMVNINRKIRTQGRNDHSAAKPQPKLEEHRGLRLKGITKLFSRMENQSVKKRKPQIPQIAQIY